MFLFGVLENRLALMALAVIIAVLLYNVKKHFSRPDSSRENIEKNAKKQFDQSFTGLPKPESLGKWEVEFFELTQRMTARIDAKMSAIASLIHDADRVGQRVEILVERLDQLLREKKMHRKKEGKQTNKRKKRSERTNRTTSVSDSYSAATALPSATPVAIGGTTSGTTNALFDPAVILEESRLMEKRTLELSGRRADIAEDYVKNETYRPLSEFASFSERPKRDRSATQTQGASETSTTLGELLIREKQLEKVAAARSETTPPPDVGRIQRSVSRQNPPENAASLRHDRSENEKRVAQARDRDMEFSSKGEMLRFIRLEAEQGKSSGEISHAVGLPRHEVEMILEFLLRKKQAA